MWDEHRSWPAQPVDKKLLKTAEVESIPAGERFGGYGPGDIVWAWVPFGRQPGDGKDRPCVVVAREPAQGTVLAVPLTSREHENDADYLFLGYGEWNEDGPASWARISVLLRIRERGIRGQLGSLDGLQLRALRSALRIRRR